MLVVVAFAEVASAQPLGWAVSRSADGGARLEVVDLGSGVLRVAFDAPNDVSFSPGALTPDGRFYLLPTSEGLRRFRTDSLAADGMIGPPDPVTQIALAPSGTRVHTVGPLGHAVVDWESGDSVTARCCAGMETVMFTPNGRLRIELARLAFERAQLRAIATQTGVTVWRVNLPYQWIEMAVSDTQVALNTDSNDSRAVLVFGVSDGVLRAWLPGVAPNAMIWRDQELLISQIEYVDPPVPSTYRLRLIAIDQTGQRRVIADRRPVHQNSLTGSIALSSDGRRAYWLYYDSPVSNISSMTYEVIDLETSARLGGGLLSNLVVGLAVENPAPCLLQVPSTVIGAVEGGPVAIPVVAGPNCGQWSVPDNPRVLNPGPHPGSATLLVQTWPNAEGQPQNTRVFIGTATAMITQPSSVPASPTLEAAPTSGDRLRLSWTPAVGAGITAFVVRGASAGGQIADVLTVPGHLRTWTSSPLPAGSYEVELAAINGAGRSVPSERRRFSVGHAGTPDPPTGLMAHASDDRVAFSWTPAPSGPAPSGFVIEAGVAGSQQWAAVARSDVASFVATRVPAGLWQVRVRAATAGGVSEPSDAVSVSTAPCSAPPGAPQQPWAIWTSPTVTLRWAPPVAGSVESYVIEAGSVSGQADLGRFTVPGDRTSITEPVSPLLAFVRVRARNACGESAASLEVPVIVY
jgi:hypothetical protein